ncbi:adenosylcobinamide amidohydrolase [Bacillota bacterium LX-D]|nr:adenosylcobinamide amidohydrolase [Bacillota bacterium LX-D]
MLEELVYIHQQIPISGVTLEVPEPNTLLIKADQPLKVASSAILGGHLRTANYILNHTVDLNYGGDDPEKDLQQVAAGLELKKDIVGMMTAVSIKNTLMSCCQIESLKVVTLCTAGIGNPGVAGIPIRQVTNNNCPGTINLIVLIDGNLTEAAMINAVMTATEAKARSLFKKQIKLANGEQVTGTTSDAIVVACTGNGKSIPYAGTATDLGYLIGKTVYESLTKGIDLYLDYKRKEKEAVSLSN